MLVVISDLHFEEEASDAILGSGGGMPIVQFERNLPPVAFEQVIAGVAAEAERNGAKRLDFLLAGDIFDLHRTQLWFGDALRPYVSCSAVAAGSPLEQKILGILDAIAREPRVNGSFAVFQRLSRGQYFSQPGDPSSLSTLRIPVTLNYLPGNHDRLVNSTASTRSRVCGFLGIQPPVGPFPHFFIPSHGDPRVLVRHGHEYDRFNFSEDHSGDDPFPQTLPQAQYDGATFGDFITVDVASRLPYLFRRIHHDPQIVASPQLLTIIYLRLLEFDDVRPQSALVDFLLDIPESGLTRDEIWDQLKPVVKQLLEDISDDEFFRAQLSRLRPGFLDPLKAALSLKVWRIGLPLMLLRPLAGLAKSGGRGDGPEQFAAREAAVKSGAVRFVIAGHTHEPQLAPLGTVIGEDRYYVDTGTWRNRLLSPPDRPAFERVKSLTYVTLYASDEDAGHPARANKQESFDYWSGYTQRWPLQ